MALLENYNTKKLEPILFRSKTSRLLGPRLITASSTCGHRLPSGSRASNTSIITSAASITYTAHTGNGHVTVLPISHTSTRVPPTSDYNRKHPVLPRKQITRPDSPPCTSSYDSAVHTTVCYHRTGSWHLTTTRVDLTLNKWQLILGVTN